MKIEYVKNPIWANKDQANEINLTVKFFELDDEIQFTATPYDVMDYGVLLYNNANNGDYGPIAPYVPPKE